MSHLFTRSDAGRIPLPDKSVDLILGSPPYCDARTYGINAQRDCTEWVEWMLRLTTEAVRVSRGLVLWVVAGVTRDHCYWPACEGLLWEWWSRGGECWRPAYWRRHGIPGTGGDKWFRSDIEYVLAFKDQGNDFWADNMAMANKAKHHGGSNFSYRTANGKRVGHQNTRPEMVNPGNLICTNVGKGHMGSDYAHENEAPFPEDLAEFFIRSFCPPAGTILDPFSGSGTTVATAAKFGRNAIGGDLRLSQCQLGSRRLARPHAPAKVAKCETEESESFALSS